MKVDCCVNSLTEIQDLEGIGNFLKFVLKASPYIILIPSLGSGVLNDGVRRAAAKQIVEMSIAKAVEKVTAAGKLPEVTDAVKSVHGIIRFKMLDQCMHEMSRHYGRTEGAFWSKLHTLYSLEGESESAPASGWFSGW
jgi:hypothetical protein